MKMKIVILLLLFQVNSYAQKLPVNGLCWSDIKAAVGGTCLDDAFANANSAWFDATYAESGNCLMEFRNYGNTTCRRPTGLRTLLYIYRTTCSGQNERYFTGSFLEASQAAYDISHSSSCVPSGWTGSQSINYSVGDTLYHNQSGYYDCSYVSDGYYLIAPYQGYPPNWSGVFTWPLDIYQVQNGVIVAITPSENTTIPVVSTNLAYFVDPGTAYFEATVNDNGGAPVTSRGFCWSTSIDPTIYNNTSSNGSNTGFFYHTEYSLGQSITYYVRAYATNSVGTAYGDNIPINTDFEYQ